MEIIMNSWIDMIYFSILVRVGSLACVNMCTISSVPVTKFWLVWVKVVGTKKPWTPNRTIMSIDDAINRPPFCRLHFEIYFLVSWWRHQMEAFSALLNLCVGNSPVTGEFPSHRPVTRSFDVFFYLCLSKWWIKQSWDWWFETPSRSLWRNFKGETCILNQNYMKVCFQASSQHYAMNDGITYWLIYASRGINELNVLHQ